MLSNHYGYSLATGTKNSNNSDIYSFKNNVSQSNSGYDRKDYTNVANGYDLGSQLAGMGTLETLPPVIKKLATKAGTSRIISEEVGLAQAAAPETLGLSELALAMGIAGTYALHLLSKHYSKKAAEVRSYNDALYDRAAARYDDDLYRQQLLQTPGTAGTLGSIGVRMPVITATPPPTEPE